MSFTKKRGTLPYMFQDNFILPLHLSSKLSESSKARSMINKTFSYTPTTAVRAQLPFGSATPGIKVEFKKNIRNGNTRTISPKREM